VTLAPSPLEILANAPTRILPTLRDASGRQIFVRPIEWSSEDPSVAIVDATGTVTGLKAGSTTVIAQVEGVTGRASVIVSTLSLTSVAAGGFQSCALTPAGAAYCWGFSGDNSGSMSSTIPRAVFGGLELASLAVGGSFACGRTPAGMAYCWGGNSTGTLGNGSTTSNSDPVAVHGGRTFASLTTGLYHACGLTPAGAAYCWGSGFDGELGTGSGDGSSIPVAVSGGLTFASLSAGSFHTCGVTSSAEAYCWGSNAWGQLGDGSTSPRSLIPVAVSGGLAFSSVSSGNGHTCGLTAGGTAYCWGANSWGQLGNAMGAGMAIRTTTPVEVEGGHTFTSLTASSAFSCGVTVSGGAYCWGSNADGRLGIGTGGVGQFNPFDFHVTPTAVAGGIGFATVSAGIAHVCGMSTGGIAYCWGAGSNGQLGRESRTTANRPVKVGGQP
jgi:alpha-tubulin suppressor-like RCC1 family protein